MIKLILRIGRNKWKKYSGNPHVLSSILTDDQVYDKIKDQRVIMS